MTDERYVFANRQAAKLDLFDETEPPFNGSESGVVSFVTFHPSGESLVAVTQGGCES